MPCKFCAPKTKPAKTGSKNGKKNHAEKGWKKKKNGTAKNAKTDSKTIKHLRLCPDDHECRFFGTLSNKAEENSAQGHVESQGEQQSSFFLFQVKSNERDAATRINQYEMNITLFVTVP